ncbi:MAG: NRDE family protein [Betaproteobacteria bacterium]
MCLILLACRSHPDFSLIVAANRDEFFERPTLPAARWTDNSSVIGGRDLEKGGSWLAAACGGRLAAVTNFRDPHRPNGGTRSRGLLISDYVSHEQTPAAFLDGLQKQSDHYDGFNLIVADRGDAFHFSNISNAVTALPPGVHGLSNHLLNTRWPKVERCKAAMTRLLTRSGETLVDDLFAALLDAEIPLDADLPATGVSLDWERRLSTVFITGSVYGTRASTVVLIDYAGAVTLVERRFAPDGKPDGTTALHLPAPSSATAALEHPAHASMGNSRI